MSDTNGQKSPLAERWYTVAEAAIVLRCKDKTIRKFIELGQLQARRLPNGRLLIQESELARILAP